MVEDQFNVNLLLRLQLGDVHSRSKSTHTTALFKAAHTGNVCIVNLLLAAGADPCALSQGGWLALHTSIAREVYNKQQEQPRLCRSKGCSRPSLCEHSAVSNQGYGSEGCAP